MTNKEKVITGLIVIGVINTVCIVNFGLKRVIKDIREKKHLQTEEKAE